MRKLCSAIVGGNACRCRMTPTLNRCESTHAKPMVSTLEISETDRRIILLKTLSGNTVPYRLRLDRVAHRRVFGTLCLRHTGWYPTERDIEYLIGL
uniref:Uncharacterized protein n=1 Tax=Hyaloperonospora arabidopsidis (strain Emoy2) TaxID=559515 RepID=M4BJT4_HYAAE